MRTNRKRRKRILLFFYLVPICFLLGFGIFLLMDSGNSIDVVNKMYHPKKEFKVTKKANDDWKEKKVEKNEKSIEQQLEEAKKFVGNKVKEAKKYLESKADDKSKDSINTKVEEKKETSSKPEKKKKSWLDYWWVALLGGWLVGKIFGGD